MSLGGGVVGGFSDVKPADDEVRSTFHTPEVRTRVGELLGHDVNDLEVHEYRTQVVAGTNFRVKAKVNGEKTVVLKAHRPLPHTGEPLQVHEANEGEEL